MTTAKPLIHIAWVYTEHCGATDGIMHTNHKDITCPVCLENMAKKTDGKGDTVRLPRALTAENGAKALLIGEFFETVQRSCPECDGDDEDVEGCETCHGQGVVNQWVPVEWTTIKQIYKRIVENLSAEATKEVMPMPPE